MQECLASLYIQVVSCQCYSEPCFLIPLEIGGPLLKHFWMHLLQEIMYSKQNKPVILADASGDGHRLHQVCMKELTT